MAQTTAAVPTGPIEDAGRHTTSSHLLKDQAASAALYVTKPESQIKNGYEFLDSDNKLSSAGAAASLKYARADQLPSYPSAGLKKDDSAAGAAASLGWANQKSFEHWKPDPSKAASSAAFLAKDYKMAPLWQPEQSAHGAKAALLAHRDGGKVEIWQPEASKWGNSAATQAMTKERAGGLAVNLDYGHTELGRQGSLLAATGAMSSSRKRAESTPVIKAATYPDEANAASNALNAATSAHRSQSRRSKVDPEIGATPFTNMSRDMYTSHPPVAPEVEEQNRQDTLRASAIAMAKQMYNVQQKQIDAATSAQIRGAQAAHQRRPSSVSSADEVPPMRFNNLQEAAQKLAQERLSKLHDEHMTNREYRDYYGSTPKPQSRLSIRGRTRYRSSSLGNSDADLEQSNKIRAQMSIFSSNISQVDAKKRQQDRESLIAAAQRNVTKSLHNMDERVFQDTGKIAPSLLSEWEVKAHAAAQAKSDTRMENHGKIHIGGGQFINQSAVDLVAARNVQPVLDEINEKAEAERERQAALKLEQETQKRKAAEKKMREKEEKDINKKLAQQDKEEKKLAKQEEKAAAKEKRNSTKAEEAGVEAPAAAVVAEEPATTEEPITEPSVEPTVVEPEPETTTEEPTTTEPTIAERREASTPVPIRTSMEDQASVRMRESANEANKDDGAVTPMSPTTKEGGKVKSWLKTKFSRRMSKGSRPVKEEKNVKEKEPASSFVGGAALTGASANNSTASLTAKSSSIKDVANASASAPVVDEGEEYRGRTERRDSEVSALSEEPTGGREDEEFQEARDNFDEDLAPPPTFPAEKSSSPVRSTKFTEDI
ncbi:uncharacterized protein LY89DRAFT_686282 [Mollisia scopiformis]|uniref:Eisosome protein 1 n=1 Tax=Mollisia scopiformis TaxID=149040 RepID=A0A194X5W0_MOLSC|nr:uncharacterized protein LY89DRAFT_686282 [Mollisia scopiformis]KUJ15566.1 hypothetical protein LY89DRAFT_686282 [Mollisia scopiformis]